MVLNTNAKYTTIINDKNDKLLLTYIDKNNSIKYTYLDVFNCQLLDYDNKEVRQAYNNEYWSLHGHKYTEERSKSIEYKKNQRIYNEKYKERPKYIHKDNYFHAPSQQDLTVVFKFSFYR